MALMGGRRGPYLDLKKKKILCPIRQGNDSRMYHTLYLKEQTPACMIRRAQNRQACKKHPNQNDNCVCLYKQLRSALVSSPLYRKPKINSKRFTSLPFRILFIDHLRDLYTLS